MVIIIIPAASALSRGGGGVGVALVLTRVGRVVARVRVREADWACNE